MLDQIAEKYGSLANSGRKVKLKGRVERVVGLVIEANGPTVTIGEKCFIKTPGIQEQTLAEVVGFRDNKVLLMPLGELFGIGPGSEVIASGEQFQVEIGADLKGRVLNGFGQPIDGKGPIRFMKKMNINNPPPPAMLRKRILDPITTGIRAIDSLLTVGKGQRVGIFSGSGVGKSTMISMIARNTSADINVIALIGERGREVREFLEKDLGEEGLKRSVVVVVTSDEPALVRIKGAYVATTIAEFFRDQGQDVMFLMDSATRVAMAQREVGLSIGEPPTTKGYPPSVFAMLPKLAERTGQSESGSITAFYAVLVEADDVNEPIGDSLRSILDGHVVLSRRLASLNHYPAIDVLESISRLARDVTVPQHQQDAAKMLQLIASYREAEDLINIGAYVQGSNPVIDLAIKMNPGITGFLQQAVDERTEYSATVDGLQQIMQEAV